MSGAFDVSVVLLPRTLGFAMILGRNDWIVHVYYTVHILNYRVNPYPTLSTRLSQIVSMAPSRATWVGSRTFSNLGKVLADRPCR